MAVPSFTADGSIWSNSYGGSLAAAYMDADLYMLTVNLFVVGLVILMVGMCALSVILHCHQLHHHRVNAIQPPYGAVTSWQTIGKTTVIIRHVRVVQLQVRHRPQEMVVVVAVVRGSGWWASSRQSRCATRHIRLNAVDHWCVCAGKCRLGTG